MTMTMNNTLNYHNVGIQIMMEMPICMDLSVQELVDYGAVLKNT